MVFVVCQRILVVGVVVLAVTVWIADLDNILGYGPLIREYVFFLESKLAFHRNHPEFNGME